MIYYYVKNVSPDGCTIIFPFKRLTKDLGTLKKVENQKVKKSRNKHQNNMSTRSLRKAQNEQEQLKTPLKDKDIESEYEETISADENPYLLLLEESGENEDNNDIIVLNEQTGVQFAQGTTLPSKKATRKTPNNKSNLKAVDKSSSSATSKPMVIPAASQLGNKNAQLSQPKAYIIERKYFNYEAELVKQFGSAIAREESSSLTALSQSHLPKNTRSKILLKYLSKYILTKPSSVFLSLPPLSITLVQEDSGVYRFIHSPEYVVSEMDYFTALNSHSLEPLEELRRQSPCHIGVLLSLADIMISHTGQYTAAFELVSLALFLIERTGFDSKSIQKIKWDSGKITFDYAWYENRFLFGTLFRYINLLSRRGCKRSAFEFAKLLYSLSPKTDPLGMKYSLDYHALACNNYLFLLSNEYYSDAEHSALLNYHYSKAYCLFMINKKDEATETIKNAMKQWPLVMQMLNDKNILNIDDDLLSNWPVLDHLSPDHSSPMYIQAQLYTERCGSFWKLNTELNEWLRDALVDLILECNDSLLPIASPEVKCCLSLYRHIYLLDLKDVKFSYPKTLPTIHMNYHDPFPPLYNPENYSCKEYKEHFGEMEEVYGSRKPALETRLRERIESLVAGLNERLSVWWLSSPERSNTNLEPHDRRNE